MTSQPSELVQDSFSPAIGPNSGGSPQHETRYFSSKRAREIQAEEGITSPYRSSALPPPSFSTNGAFNSGTLLSDSNSGSTIDFLKPVGSKTVANSNGSNQGHLSPFPAPLRRARADTLPTSLSGSRPPFNLSHHPSSSLSVSTGPTTPTMPTPTTGELLHGDENNTVGKTLDYLGLDVHDNSSLSKMSTSSGALPQIKVDLKAPTNATYGSGPSIATIPSLRRDANRIRSFSVSAAPKYDDQLQTSAMTSANLFPPGNAAVQQFHQAHSRPRAISLSMLDTPNEVVMMRNKQNSMYSDLTDQSSQQVGSTPSTRSLGGEQLIGMMVSGMMEGKKKQQQQAHEDDYLLDHNDIEMTRSGLSSPGLHTPECSQNTPPPQTPTRSLWIGNIDPTLTNEDLMRLFSPYGSIESLRLLPDKECGFINFHRVDDAVRAKDDIMDRMGGRVGSCIVRIGFGKADAAFNSHDLSPSSQTQSQPTRALWVGNIPTSTTPQALQNIFAPYGPIESARVLTHKNCGFVNFERLEDAVKAKRALHGKEVLGSAVGPVRIGYAKNDNYAGNVVLSMVMGTAGGLTEKQLMMRELSGGSDEDIDESIDNRTPINYFTNIPPVADPNPSRKPDASRLREIRKRLDSGHCSAKEVESIAAEVMDECVELSSDYIGNTVIQKLFERCTENTKLKMLEKIAPHMATIGIHKNGTWAAQKIIDCAKHPSQMHFITSNVRPYTPPLLLDQFGNYVVQCCLRLGPSRNQFIFDAMVDRCWEIAQGRFGARAMRACLESQHVTKKQQKQVAIAIVMNAVSLSTNPNGALLLTWLLDTSQFPGRYRILSPKLAPHLAHLCTHKLASLTVLKIINQRHETDARDLTISNLFFSANDQVLEEVLSDQVHGVGVVQKVLASPYVEQAEKQRLAEKVKLVLGKLKVQQVQGYKRLLEELGMVSDPSLNGASMSSVQNSVGMPPPNQAAASTPTSENPSSPQHEQLSPSASALPLSSEASTPSAGPSVSSPLNTPNASFPPAPPMFMNTMPMTAHPHSGFPPTGPYPHMGSFTPFVHPSTLAAVAAGMYGHPAMFNAAAYPYMLAASGAIPPPMLNTTPPPPAQSSPETAMANVSPPTLSRSSDGQVQQE
ncbi:1486_t:CDS:10 [Paraglomus brasilianum]|uniref:1486_t:CDS:1 n=1 Tax=Paraglomus brasilianum TaxID=144538 RepID=A0A9N8W2R9_9GLOM|nr:1486_t:CDS:10 [Paraglomus brasilianum]